VTGARTVLLVLAAGIPGALPACADPVHADLVASLGPEASGVSPGPLHRPGQPCLVCHGGMGPATLKLSVGGTVYSVRGQEPPAVGAAVQIEDIEGNYWTTDSNAAGNFFVEAAHFAPAYPIRMEVVSADGTLTQRMQTYAGRNGSCADCHSDPTSPTSPGRVYLSVGANDDAGAGGTP
jgi:hypothetical protein